MGLGDSILGTADAREAQEKEPDALCVFGNEIDRKVFTDDMLDNNPRICHNLESYKGKLLWIPNHPGARPYLLRREGQKVIYNMDFKARLGEIYFSDKEKSQIPNEDYIYIEPNTKVASDDGAYCFPLGFNKAWIKERWVELAKRLSKDHLLVQCGGMNAQSISYVRRKYTKSFREALPIIAGAKLVITTDGAVHHASAALKKKAVVIWGEVTSPKILGYDTHSNQWAGFGPCGSLTRCQGCKDAMRKITVEQVEEAVRNEIRKPYS